MVGLIHTDCVRDLLDDGGASVPGHRGTDWNLYILGCLHWNLMRAAISKHGKDLNITMTIKSRN